MKVKIMSKERDLLERWLKIIVWPDYYPLRDDTKELLAQPEQDAFRAGIMYSAKKFRHATVARERFTGNDVALFLEMEACEISNDSITKCLEMDDE